MVPKGGVAIEPYLGITVFTGLYDANWKRHDTSNFYRVESLLFTQVGVTHWMDFQITPRFGYNFSQGQSDGYLADSTAGLGFRLYEPEKGSWLPHIKATLVEDFPIGKYQNLNPKKKLTDLSGNGSYGTRLGVIFRKEYHLKEFHFLSAYLTLRNTFFTSTHVKGLNVYGGGKGTKGVVRPGNIFIALLSFEYTFNLNWAFSLDNVYSHQNKSHFSGCPGRDALGEVAPLYLHSTEQISFAPALEYNFSKRLGIIGGVWFTAFGRNSAQFTTGLIAVDYFF